MTPHSGPQDVPAGLADAGARFWEDVSGAFTLRPDERRLLLEVCREVDLIDRLEETVRTGDLVARGSQGQPVAAPCVQELRQHRNTLAALLRQLRLPDEADEDDTRGGLSGVAVSAAARRAARARWDRPRGTTA